MMQAIPTVSPVFDPARGREALAVLRRRWRKGHPRAADVAALRGLDAAALRDLGLSRSELESVACEAAGAAEPTRRRIARRSDAAPRDGPRPRGSAAPRRPWVRSAWPVGLLIAAAAAGWQPAAPELDGPAPAASVPDTGATYLPAQFAAQEAAAPAAPQAEAF
jgi:uncharacterized protein YjiS (DUF1127 family)